jgi:uncharacterized protein (TIGR02145 family)/prepilin-type N-terminal cleavage/methylation domain-containing protein
MYNKMKKNKTGFTLIEIIVVVFIIGMIISFVVVSFSTPRQKSRDVKRISDITQLQIALNTYRQFEGSYPESLTAGEPLIGSSTGIVFLQSVPENAKYPDDDCVSGDYVYTYDSTSNRYSIEFCLEGPLDNYSPGLKCVTPEKIFNQSCEEIVSGPCYGASTLIYQGYLYGIVAIGDQCWFAENLRATKYNDNIEIPNIINNTEWNNATTGAYSWYGNDEAGHGDYGLLYNWHAVNTGKLCPDGWRVPSDPGDGTAGDFADLVAYLSVEGQGGPGTDSGGKMKSSSTEPDPHPRWKNPNVSGGATLNSSGFNALPAGYRVSNGTFTGLGSHAHFWSSSANDSSAWVRGLHYNGSLVSRVSYAQNVGRSVRCLKID